MLVEMYERWLLEVWGKGDEAVAAELLHADLVDHNAVPGPTRQNVWRVAAKVSLAKLRILAGTTSKTRTSPAPPSC